MSDFDEECVYLELKHGKASKMECLRPWSKPEYKNAATPFSLSATYKITYEDGADVEIAGFPAYALSQGSFWYVSDSKADRIDSVFARDDRVLAYLAHAGQILRREKMGECILPSQDEADCILDGLDIPFEALKYGSEWACKNMDRWVNDWKQRGLIKWDEDNHEWHINRPMAIERADWIDNGWGEIVSCNALPLSDSWPANMGTCVPNVNPYCASCDFEVKYANGRLAILSARGWEILMGAGFRGSIFSGSEFKSMDGEPYGRYRFFNARLMATAAKALAKGVAIPVGKVTLLDESTALNVLREYDIVPYPVSYTEEWYDDLSIVWKKRWLDTGICVDDTGRYGSCVTKFLLDEWIRRIDTEAADLQKERVRTGPLDTQEQKSKEPTIVFPNGEKHIIVDSNHGRVKRISVEPGVDVLLSQRNPITMETALIVEYENTKEYACFPPWETLALGWVRCHTDDGQPGFLCNKQVVAAIGRAIDNLEPFLYGDIAIPNEEEAEGIIKELGIPHPPISYDEMGKTRPCIKIELMKKWKKSGKLCQMKDGSYEIENLPYSKNVAEVRMALGLREKDDGREGRIAKSGKAVAFEAVEAERHENRFIVGTTKMKKKKSKAKKKPMVRRWPKNKAEHRRNQILLWGGQENLAQYETREMKSSTGKMCTYHVKVDSSGRMWILDTGEDAPEGYYSQSSRYYVLKRNARVARRCSTWEQLALWFACKERFKAPGGFLVSLGNRGLIRKISGKYAEMNLGASERGRKFLDSAKAFYPKEGVVIGGMKLKRSKYAMIIEQVKVKPGAWEACDWTP